MLLAFFHSFGIAICKACHGAFLEEGQESTDARDIFFCDSGDVLVDWSSVWEWRSGSKELEQVWREEVSAWHGRTLAVW